MDPLAGTREARVAARLEAPLTVAALLVIPNIVVQTTATTGVWQRGAWLLDWVIWGAFFAEVVIMLSVTTDRRRWLRTHKLDTAIVVMTPPFAPALIESFRALRLVRLLRILRLVRTVETVRRVFSLQGLVWAMAITAVTVLAGGVAFAQIESAQHVSVWDGIWWASSTVTTVGYGDLSPRTTAGRVIAIVLMFVGIGFVAMLTAAIAQKFVVVGEQPDRDWGDIAARLADLQRVAVERDSEVVRQLAEISDRLLRIEQRIS